MSQGSIRCDCGSSQASLAAAPLFRVICHCTLCQRYNRAPFGDVALFRAADVEIDDESGIEYTAWKQPPMVQRGRCRACDGSAWERIGLPGLALVGVPVENVQSQTLPPPAAHIYYGTRVADVDDGLPKHEGGFSSNLVWGRLLIGSLLKRRRAA